MKWCRASIKGLNSGVSRQYPLLPRRPLSIH
jgi:hypothetical protein